jgi:23S rRNA pseudouridine1911/1915/1917 synthase
MMEYIIYEDKEILVCKKPAGLPVQSARIGTRDMVNILKNYRKEKEDATYIGLVHRLDQPVEGVMVFAKTKDAAAKLSRQVTDGRMKKQYLAVVCGKPKLRADRLVDYLLKDGRTNTSRIVKEGTKEAKRAELSYEILEEKDDYALAEISLFTGRHHQIRVQMAGAGMPLAGDRKYNRGEGAQAAATVALAAYRLTFLHPKTGKEMTFQVKPEGALFSVFKNIKNQY